MNEWLIFRSALLYMHLSMQQCCSRKWICCHSSIVWMWRLLPTSVSVDGHVSIWRHPTANYNVTSYPYFVFHLKQFEFSSFSETFKGYAYHVLQYRLIHVIEFAFCWSNHICHFMLQNMTMLVNFDLTPQQYCQKLHLTMCQSHFYKHDFAVISSGPGPSIHYV